MSAKNCQEVTLPPSARHYLGEKHGAHHGGSSVFRVAKLLLAKLGDFVLPSVDSGTEEGLEEDSEDYNESESSENSGGMMCLYLHKRDDQPAHEVVQKVLRYGVKTILDPRTLVFYHVTDAVCHAQKRRALGSRMESKQASGASKEAPPPHPPL